MKFCHLHVTGLWILKSNTPTNNFWLYAVWCNAVSVVWYACYAWVFICYKLMLIAVRDGESQMHYRTLVLQTFSMNLLLSFYLHGPEIPENPNSVFNVWIRNWEVTGMVARWPVGAEMYVFVTTSRLVLGHPVSYHKHLPQVLKTKIAFDHSPLSTEYVSNLRLGNMEKQAEYCKINQWSIVLSFQHTLCTLQHDICPVVWFPSCTGGHCVRRMFSIEHRC